MSRLKNRNNRHDPYYRKAKDQHYASRAVYKLEEVDRRFRILKKGHRVLDLGCWPGSWLQYAAQRVGPTGRVTGVDLKETAIPLPRWVRVVIGDVYELDVKSLLDPEVPAYDVVLSDMAPRTSGIRVSDVARSIELFSRAVQIAGRVTRPGGHFVGKIFQGAGFDEAVNQTKQVFRRMKTIRPQGSRPGSMELYVVALDRRPGPVDGKAGSV